MLAKTSSYLFLISLCLTLTTAAILDPADPLSHKNAREFLDAHNAIRKQHNVPELVWDKEVARYAHHHGNQLVKTCTMAHSVNGPYGENILWAKNPDLWSPTKVVASWASESAWFNRATLECSEGPTKCGHYTQLVWYDTKRVGCRMLPCLGQPGLIAVCNYDPPGNFYREDPLVSHELGPNDNPLILPLPQPGMPLPQPGMPLPKPELPFPQP